METKVISFQVVDGWLYILKEDGGMARKHIEGEWEEVILPNQEDLKIPVQSNAGEIKYERAKDNNIPIGITE